MSEDTATAIMMIGLFVGASFVGLLTLLVTKTGNMRPPMLLPAGAMFPLTAVAVYNLAGAVVVWAGLRSIVLVLALSMLLAVAVATEMARVWRHINDARLHRSPPYDGLP